VFRLRLNMFIFLLEQTKQLVRVLVLRQPESYHLDEQTKQLVRVLVLRQPESYHLD